MGGLTAVVDASLVIDSIAQGHPRYDAAVDVIASSVAAPRIIDIEVASALRRLVFKRRLDATSAERSLIALASRPSITRYSYEQHLPRIWQLRDRLSPYDACYVALAEALRLPLATTDARLAAAAALYCDIYPLDAAPPA